MLSRKTNLKKFKLMQLMKVSVKAQLRPTLWISKPIYRRLPLRIESTKKQAQECAQKLYSQECAQKLYS